MNVTVSMRADPARAHSFEIWRFVHVSSNPAWRGQRLGRANPHSCTCERYKGGPLIVSDPWSNATPKGATVGAGYMKITNTGTVPDRLIGGSTESASKFEVHQMKMENGVMKMRPVQGGLAIMPGETVELTPDSYHVMLIGLKNRLAVGDHVKATLMFEKAGAVNIEYDVLAIGAKPGQTAKPGSEMPGMKMPMPGTNMPGH